MNRVSVLIKELSEFPFCFGHVRTEQEDKQSMTQDETSPEMKSPGALILDFLDFRAVRNKFLLFIHHQSMDLS